MRYALIAFAAVPLSACNALNTDVQRGYALGPGWTTGAAFTTADVRMITQRTSPALGNQLICTEPSPDVAKALSTAASLTAQGGNGPASGSFGASSASAEAVAELAGRSTALLGLRDGLYRACEAYANGVIGQDAYALVLSRYGQLMTTLFLGQDITGAAGAEGKAAATSAALQALSNQQGGNSPQNSSASPASNKASPASKNSNQGAAASTPGAAAPTTLLATAHGDDLKPRLLLVANPVAGGGAAGGGAAGGGAAGGDTPKAGTPNGSTPNNTGAQPQTASSAGVSTASALALTRMNEDYLNLDLELTHLLVVACINENDPTRFRPKAATVADTPATNGWLQENICANLTLQHIEDRQDAVMKAVAGVPKFQPVNPEVAAVQLSTTSPGKQTNANTSGQAGDPTLKKVQTALLAQVKLGCANCNPGTPDGLEGPRTTSAVYAYQVWKKLPNINGDPLDSATMTSLAVSSPAAPAPSADGAAPPKTKEKT